MRGSAAYAAVEAAHHLVVTDYRPLPPGWPKTHRLSITVIADLHAGGPNMGLERVRQVVDGANALESDLIVILGDFYRDASLRHRARALGCGTGAAEGAARRLFDPRQSRWWFDIKGVRSALAAVRLPVLENDALLIGDGGRRFWLAGLGDQIAHFLGPSRFQGVDDLPVP